MRKILLLSALLFFPFYSYAKIKDVVVFEFGNFLRFALEFTKKTDLTFSADRNKIRVIFTRNIGYGRKRTKSYKVVWKGRKLTISFRRNFSYVRYFVIPLPYKLIIDVGFSKRDIDDIIETQEEADKKVVVIDAGHGGRDPGTLWRRVREKDITLKLAKILYSRLKRSKKFLPVLTRDRDVFVELDKRSAVANASYCDAFISIHVNSTEKRKSPSGFEIFYFSQKFSRYALKVAQKENGIMFDENSKIVFDIYSDIREEQSFLFAKTIAKHLKGLKRVLTVEGAPLYVLAGTFCPGVLIEIGFIDNPKDKRDLLSYKFLVNLADKIYRAISDFLSDN